MGSNNTRVVLFLSETEVNECGKRGRTSENNKIKLKEKFEKYHVPDSTLCAKKGTYKGDHVPFRAIMPQGVGKVRGGEVGLWFSSSRAQAEHVTRLTSVQRRV